MACDNCQTEEECRRCLIIQTAEHYDHITANLTRLNADLALAKEKGLLNHAQSVPIARSIDQLAKDTKASSALFYAALDPEEEGDGA